MDLPTRPKSGISLIPFLKRRSKTMSPPPSPSNTSFLPFDTPIRVVEIPSNAPQPPQNIMAPRQSATLGPAQANLLPPSPVPRHNSSGSYPSITGIMESHLDFGYGSSAPATLVKKSHKKATSPKENLEVVSRRDRTLSPIPQSPSRVISGRADEEVNVDEWVLPTSPTPSPVTLTVGPTVGDLSRYSSYQHTQHSHLQSKPQTPRNRESRIAQIDNQATNLLTTISSHLEAQIDNPSPSPIAESNTSSPVESSSIRSWREARKRSIQLQQTGTSYRSPPLPPPLTTPRELEREESNKKLERPGIPPKSAARGLQLTLNRGKSEERVLPFDYRVKKSETVDQIMTGEIPIVLDTSGGVYQTKKKVSSEKATRFRSEMNSR